MVQCVFHCQQAAWANLVRRLCSDLQGVPLPFIFLIPRILMCSFVLSSPQKHHFLDLCHIYQFIFILFFPPSGSELKHIYALQSISLAVFPSSLNMSQKTTLVKALHVETVRWLCFVYHPNILTLLPETTNTKRLYKALTATLDAPPTYTFLLYFI